MNISKSEVMLTRQNALTWSFRYRVILYGEPVDAVHLLKSSVEVLSGVVVVLDVGR